MPCSKNGTHEVPGTAAHWASPRSTSHHGVQQAEPLHAGNTSAVTQPLPPAHSSRNSHAAPGGRSCVVKTQLKPDAAQKQASPCPQSCRSGSQVETQSSKLQSSQTMHDEPSGHSGM